MPLGGWLAVTAGTFLVSSWLQARRPSRLEIGRDGLRVDVWKTWSTGAPLRRVQTVVPREQLVGVAAPRDQAGNHQLFIAHTSGWSFGTGWSGSSDAWRAHAATITDWLTLTGDRTSH